MLSALSAFAQPAEIAGTLPEDYLPGLKAILQSASRQSPDVLLKELQIARDEAKVIEADRHLWPELGGNVRYDMSQTAVSGNSNTRSRTSGLFYGVSMRKSLFHWGANRNRSEIARIEVAIRGKEYAEAYRGVALQLRGLYLELVVRNAVLRAARSDLSRRVTTLASAREKRDAGSLAPGQVTGLEHELAEREINVERLQVEFDSLRRRLGRISGIGEIPADSLPVEVPEPRYDERVASEMLAAMLREGGRNTFSAQAAQLGIQRAELNYRIAKVRLLPRFDATVEHSRESSTNASESALSQTAITRESAGIRGDWNIFDGFATKSAKLQAKIDKRESEKHLRDVTDAAVQEAQRAERLAALSARALKLADQRRWGAEEGLRRAESELKDGRASQEQVDAAAIMLLEAQAGTASARAAFLADWASYVSLVTFDPVLNNLPSRYDRAAR